jgi:ATP-dependent RNA helicase RhlE
VSIEVARRNAAAENVEQLVFRVADAESKRVAVAQLVRERALSQVIVFTNTKIGAGRLARQLEKDGLNASAIHGDKSQQERLATLEAFKKGEIAILVATDVAARGLDIAELPAVINYDLPYSPEDYIHRIGRTGRAGASGVALSLMSAADERLLDGIQKLLKRELPQQTLEVAGGRPERVAGESHGRAEGRPPREAREARPPRETREPREAPKPASRAKLGKPVSRAKHAKRPALPGATAADGYPSRAKLPGYSQDPFFYKPYEPPTQPEVVTEEAGQPPVAPRCAGASRRAPWPLCWAARRPERRRRVSRQARRPSSATRAIVGRRRPEQFEVRRPGFRQTQVAQGLLQRFERACRVQRLRTGLLRQLSRPGGR